MSKHARRIIFWLLYGVIVIAPVAAFFLEVYDGPIQRRFYLVRLMAVCMPLLLFWCAAYNVAEKLLARLALVTMGIIWTIFVVLLEPPKRSGFGILPAKARVDIHIPRLLA